MTQELQSDLLGRVENEDGIVFIGSETQPPYAGVLLESNALSGEPVFFALLKGKFSLDEQTMSTNEEEQAEPEAEEMTGSFVADANGNTVATAKGEDKRAKMEALFHNISGDATTTTTTTTTTP